MREKPVLVVGSINTDLVAISERIPSVGQTVIGMDFQIHPGGKGANQAVAVARLGYPVRMVGRLGNDSFGTQLKTQMESAGVDCTGITMCDGVSGVAVILVSRDGENCIVVTPGANAQVSPSDIDANLSAIRNAGLVLAQLEIPMETVEYLAAVCKREKVPLMLDPAPAMKLSPQLLETVEWFTPNESEASFYIGESANLPPEEVARKLTARGCKGVVLKMGSRGAYLSSPRVERFLPAFHVQALDTTAAGDAFNGAFAVGLLLGKGHAGSAMFATAAAGLSVTRRGAQPSMPTMHEVEEFLQSAMKSGQVTETPTLE